MAFHPAPYLPPPPQEFLAPSPGLSSPPGLKPLPIQYPQLCPGLPRHFLQEQQQVLEKVATQQQQLQQEQQQQQQQLQQQLHRAHLKLGAAHKRITENEELMAQLEVRLGDMEFRGAENQKRQEREMATVNVDLRDGKSFLSQVATGLSDLQQLARQAPPPQPAATSASSQARDGPGQKDCALGPLTAINQSTQTGPH